MTFISRINQLERKVYMTWVIFPGAWNDPWRCLLISEREREKHQLVVSFSHPNWGSNPQIHNSSTSRVQVCLSSLMTSSPQGQFLPISPVKISLPEEDLTISSLEAPSSFRRCVVHHDITKFKCFPHFRFSAVTASSTNKHRGFSSAGGLGRESQSENSPRRSL